MINIFFIFIIVIFFILFFEIILRFRKLKDMPIKFRILYCCFLLNEKTFNENYVISQRIHRGGFKNLKELIKHYSLISGLTTEDIYKKFILSFNNPGYYSGGHGVIEEIVDDQHGLKIHAQRPLQFHFFLHPLFSKVVSYQISFWFQRRLQLTSLLFWRR